MSLKRDLYATAGEFFGTAQFLFLAVGIADSALRLGGGVMSAPTLLLIALGFGFSLMVNVWAFCRISGAHFNPAVTLSLFLTGNISLRRGLMYWVAQFAGACAGTGALHLVTPGKILANNDLGAGVSVAQGLFLEMLLTTTLCLTVFFAAVEQHQANFLAPVAIGLDVFMCHLLGVTVSGSSINPARSLGTSVISGVFPSIHWIYYAGPFLGSFLAAGIYTAFVRFEDEAEEDESKKDFV